MKKFFIKDELNNFLEVSKITNKDFTITYNLINFKKQDIFRNVDKRDKIVFNQLLSDIRHQNKIEVELFSLFFQRNNGYEILFKRDFNNTYVKIISKNSEKQDITVCLTIYDSEFNDLDFNEYVAYNFVLLSLLNQAFLRLLDFRNKIDFELNDKKINAINKIYKTKNLSNIELNTLVNDIKFGVDEDFYDNKKNFYYMCGKKLHI